MASRRAVPVEPRAATALSPLPLPDAVITDGFWARMQELNRGAVIPHCDDSLERVGWIGNFRAAAEGTLAIERVGRLFTDSEIYKLMEAMAWEHLRRPDPGLRTRLAELTKIVALAQHDDGYLNTFYGYPGGPARYSDLEWGHELYCAGHLLQAAVAVLRCGVDDGIAGVAARAADHVCREFRAGGREGICGHPEIETALVELHRLTGDARYLEQARLFVERRGHATLSDTMYGGRDYYQDAVPVRDADVLVGHAVRALYLTAGVVDVAVETGDDELLRAAQRQFDRTLARRTYLHGGMGAYHHGEAFGTDFELPADRAYAETCAGVASVMVAWRLLLATGEARYGDVIERTLYNLVAAGPGEDGRDFFYVNTLHRRTPGVDPEPGGPSLRRTDGRRAPWFTTSCCPTNLARLLASLGSYLATSDADGLQLHQYAAASVTATLAGGRRIGVSVRTRYPDDGRVQVRIDESDGRAWRLSLRVPAWATSATVTDRSGTRPVRPGTVTLEAAWAPGDVVLLDLDIRPRLTRPDPRIDAVRGCAAVERGPLVYCLESVDQPDVDLDLVRLDPVAPLAATTRDDGSVAVRATGSVPTDPCDPWPYVEPVPPGPARPVELVLVPYHRWANRGPSTMRVWLPLGPAERADG
jgi:uncharacterized protein